MSFIFVSSNFELEIYNNVISRIFPNLNKDHKTKLLIYLVNLLNIIALVFHFDTSNYDKYEKQFRQNKYRDLYAILFMLLPFMNSSDLSVISSLDDIYTKKTKDVNINNEAPKYIYSNWQYDHCIRGKIINERKFKFEYLNHNYYLLIDTIYEVSNKLYVNWIDVLPYDLETYKNTDLYTKTKKIFDNKQISDMVPIVDLKLSDKTYDFLDMNSSKKKKTLLVKKLEQLPLSNIYNCLCIDLYESISKIDWILYDISPSYPVYSEFIPAIIVCNIMFDFDDILMDVFWINKTSDKKKIFTDKWNNFTKCLLLNNKYEIINNITISNIQIKHLAGHIIRKFQFYKNLHTLDGFSINKDNLLDEKNIQQLCNLPIEHIYTYFSDTIQQVKQTWYYLYLFNKTTKSFNTIPEYINAIKKLKSEDFKIPSSYQDMEGQVSLSLKYIYEYAKSFLYYTDNKTKTPKKLPKYWKSCSEDDKVEFLRKINYKHNDKKEVNLELIEDWFNIKLILQTANLNMANEDSIVLDNNMLRDIKKSIRDTLMRINYIIFVMCTDKIIQLVFEAMIFNGRLSYFNPHERITNESIITHDRKILIPQDLKKSTLSYDRSYYKNAYYYLTNETYDTVHSLNQDNKPVKYYDTLTEEYDGDKWYTMYAMNWISQINFFHKYINNRVIFVTGGTGVGKSSQIPKLLLYALKAIDYNNNGSVVCSQPRITPTQKNADTIASQMGVPIPVYKANDLTNMLDSIETSLKTKIKPYTNNLFIQYETSANKHPTHNQNCNHLVLKMITDGRLLAGLDNPLLKRTKKLASDYAPDNKYDIIIIDESHEHNKNMDILLTKLRYGVYFNNQVKLVIISATMDNDEPIYRRYYRHIDDNRMFPLNDNLRRYNLDRHNVDRRIHISPPGQSTRYNIEEVYDPTLDPIMEINRLINNDSGEGNILYFQPSMAEINGEIEKLHSILPDHVIALPFHSDIKDFQRKIIENLDSELPKLKIDRNLPFFDLTKEDLKKGDNKYTRVVIVATNIAEASITFPLKYVFDSGKQKQSVYDYTSNSSKIIETPITETSREQRKGRVGRIYAGKIYYLYEPNFTKNSTMKYEMSISNVCYDLYDLLTTVNTNTQLFSASENPNNPTSTQKDIAKIQVKNSSLYDIIVNQYFINNRFYNYFGDKECYDYINDELLNVFVNGYPLEYITDDKGMFYIIHPEELHIKRNIVGNIRDIILDDEYNKHIQIKYENKSYRIISKKIMAFWNILTENLFMVIYKRQNSIIYKKTSLGMNCVNIKKELSKLSKTDLDIRYIISLLYSYAFNISEEVSRLICMYVATNFDIMQIISGTFVNNKYKSDIEAFKTVNKNNKSDNHVILKILDNLHKECLNNVFKEYKKARKQRIKDKFAKKHMKLDESIDIDNLDDFTEIHFIENEPEKHSLLEEFSKKNYIKYNVLLKYITTYNKLNKILENYNKNIELSNNINLFKIERITNLLKKQIPIIDNRDKLTMCLLYGFKTNIVRNFNNKYISFYNPIIQNIYDTKKVGGDIIVSCVSLADLQNYVLYFKIDEEEKTITSLHPINIELLQHISYAYSRDIMYDKYMKLSNTKLFDNTIISNMYKKILKLLLNDIIKHSNPYTWNKLNYILDDNYYIGLRIYHDTNYLDIDKFNFF